jgi:hypothetical protein
MVHTDTQKSPPSTTRIDYTIYTLCFIFILATLFINYLLLGNKCHTDRGTFGDMFGGVNALFSGLAFLGIIISIRLQSKELKATKEELARSASAQEKSEKALAQQVHHMKLTAQLNALQLMINNAYYRKDNPSMHDIGGSWGSQHDIDNYKAKIEKILTELSK